MSKIIIELNQSNFKPLIYGTQNAFFVITDDLFFSSENITFGSNSILEFRGGSISCTSENCGTITGTNIVIDAPNAYPIFKNCKLAGQFNNPVIYADWFMETGNRDNNPNDDAPNINTALQSANGALVELSNREYHLYSPINMNHKHMKLRCVGTLLIMTVTNAIEVSANNVCIDVDKIESNVQAIESQGYFDDTGFYGSAIKFTGNAFNCTINVNRIKNVEKALDISPAYNLPSNYASDKAGVQYCKFYFQNIIASKCIYVDFVTNPNNLSGQIWVTECQFFGGRLEGD